MHSRPTLSLLILSFTVACAGADDRARVRAEQTQAALTCGQTPAPALFTHAVCLCGDLDSVGALRLDGPNASLAVDGQVSAVSEAAVQGDLLAYGGLEVVSELIVEGNLACGGDVEYTGGLRVTGDLEVAGDLRGVGELSVHGDLAVAGIEDTLGEAAVSGTRRAPSPMALPCGCADAIDPAEVVAAGREANDNAARGVSSDALSKVGESQLILSTGRYYFESPTSVGARRVRVEGAVSIYVDGGLESVGADQFELAEGASLDLYVAGDVDTVGTLSLGAEADPSALRLYVGGDAPVMVTVGEGEVFGAIYAPRASLTWVGEMQVAGAVFAKDLDGVGQVDLTYHRPVAHDVPEGECPEPDPANSGAPSDELPDV